MSDYDLHPEAFTDLDEDVRRSIARITSACGSVPTLICIR